jgi:sulfur-oxidizing protein SoxY
VKQALQPKRRHILSRGGLLWALHASGLLCAAQAGAANLEGGAQRAFDATSLDDALLALGGAPVPSQHITLTVPDSVDNGAFVPVDVSSALPGTHEICIVVATNPNPMVVRFNLPEGTEPAVSTRVKMAASGRVYAIVKARGGLYAAYRDTQVTVGACG